MVDYVMVDYIKNHENLKIHHGRPVYHHYILVISCRVKFGIGLPYKNHVMYFG